MDQNDYEIQDGVLVRSPVNTGPFQIPPGVRAIGRNVFSGDWGCPDHLVIPEGVETIQSNAFSNCYTLVTLTLPASLRTVEDEAFCDCPLLREVRFQEGLKTIGRGAFRQCQSLRQLNLPSTLETTGVQAFAGCDSLRDVDLGTGITSMPSEAFPGLSLERLYGPRIRTWSEPSLSKSTKRLILPGLPISAIPRNNRWAALRGFVEWERQGGTVDPAIRESYLISLRNRAPRFRPEFLEDLSLLSLILHEKMLSRESANVFLQRAQQAEHVEATTMMLDYLGRLPPSDPDLEVERMLQELDTGEMDPARFKASWRGRQNEDGTMTLLEYLGADLHVSLPARVRNTPITELGDRLFRNRTDLLSIVVPEGVRTIPPKAFAGCRNLTRAELPDTLEKIGEAAFRNCASLQEVRIPASLPELPDDCFRNCSSLTEVSIPEGVQKLGGGAFRGCISLTCITLPSTIQHFESNTFQGCKNLEEVRFTRVPAGSLGSLCCIVPRLKRLHFVSLDPKQSPESWNRDLFRDFARAACKLREIRIPAQVRNVASDTFKDLPHLKSWTTDPANPWLYADGPYLIARKGSVLLLSMPNLKGEAVLPEGVIEIRSRAFYRRKGLTSVTIPASIQVIHREAFALCKDLRTVHFLGAPREIARSAFHKCPAGNHLYLPKGSRWV